MKTLATASVVSSKPIRQPKKPPPIQVVTRDHVHIAGLDASLTRTGYCTPRGEMFSIVPTKIREHPAQMDIARRVNEIKHLLRQRVRHYPPMPTLFVYEGPFFHHIGTSSRLDQLRGVLRDLIIDEFGAEFIEVSPSSLKHFASGDGAADKTLMTHQARTRIEALGGRWFPSNDDEADAWHCRALGHVAAGLWEPYAEYQIDALVGTDRLDGCRLQFPNGGNG